MTDNRTMLDDARDILDGTTVPDDGYCKAFARELLRLDARDERIAAVLSSLGPECASLLASAIEDPS